MKANELMIGDWLLYDHKKPDGTQEKRYLRVVGLGLLNILLRNKEENYCLNVFNNNFELKPIPITAEILEKNGLSGLFGSYWPSGESHSIELTSTKEGMLSWTINCNEYDIMTFEYVHELQHALRLCGIEKEIEL